MQRFKKKQGHHHNGDQAARRQQSVAADLDPSVTFGGNCGDRHELIRYPTHVFLFTHY